MRTLLFSFLFSFSAGLSACSCQFTPDFCTYAAAHFNGSDTSAVVRHVKFIGYRNPEQGANLFDFVLIEHLYGATVADTISLWGQDGGNCNGPIRQLIDGEEYILLHSAAQGVFSYFGHTLENFSNPYPIYDFPGCGPAALEVNGEAISGPVAPGINAYSTDAFRSDIADCVTGKLVSTADGRLPEVAFSAWPNPSFGDMTLSFGEPVMADRIDLFDATGRLVRSFGTTPGRLIDNYLLESEGLPASVYTVRVLLASGRVGSKMVVIR